MTTASPPAPNDTPIGGMEFALRELLESDLASAGLVAVRGGKISRSYYARKLNCSPGNLTRFKELFSDYEAKAEITTGPLRHLNAMQSWVADEYKAGRLDIRDGKLDRIRFQRHFGLTGGTFMTRHAPIRELFEGFDRRAVAEGYMPLSRRHDIERIAALLLNDPPINKDRLTINQKLLAKVAGIPKNRLADPPFAELVARHNNQIRQRAESSRIDPLVHGRVFPFSGLANLWSHRFLEKVGIRFKQTAPTWAPETAKGGHLQLLDALRWIGASSVPACVEVVREASELGKVTSADDWEDALHAYRSHLVSGTAANPANDSAADGAIPANDSAADGAISALRIALECLVTAQLVPATALPLPGVKFSRRRSGHLRSVVEEGPVTELDDYVSFARATLRDAARSFGVEVEEGESDTFISSVATQLAESPPTGDISAAVRSLLDRRISAIRDRAWDVVEAAQGALQEGRRLVELADLDTAAFHRNYRDRTMQGHRRRLLVQANFPGRSVEEPRVIERGKANLLALIQAEHGGIPPTGNDRVGGYGQFFPKQYSKYGGIEAVEAMLTPTADMIGAVLTLYLCESGANVGVGRQLKRDCIEQSDLDGHRRITGSKARAKGKPIIVDLPDTSPTIRGFDIIRAAGGHLVGKAASNDDHLFLMRIGGRVQPMTAHWFTNWFKTFANSIPGLEGLALTPNTLRPSVLLHAALSNDGRLQAGMALGQHGSAVSQGYQQKAPTRLLYDANIRRFQLAFETLVLSGIDGAAERMGITREQFEARMAELRPTGLGTFCRDARGRSGDTGATCTTLDCWNDCPHLLIVAEVEAVAHLQLWQASLRTAMPEWERDRPERWEAVWLPWLCLTDAVQAKMAAEPLLQRIWKKASLHATGLASTPGYVPPKPW